MSLTMITNTMITIVYKIEVRESTRCLIDIRIAGNTEKLNNCNRFTICVIWFQIIALMRRITRRGYHETSI